MTQPGHLKLGELIARLRLDDPAKRLRLGFVHPHSYRGDYSQLAFETCPAVTVGEMLRAAESAVGATFEGWKGGDYTMDEATDCWLVAQEGTSAGETIGAVLVDLLLADDVLADTPRGRAHSEMTWGERYGESGKTPT